MKRRYLLGKGVISSKKAGINHKRYGVTSLGVVTFAQEAMKEVGVDISTEAFSVKMTGGPAGDVAGNCLKLLFQRCPRVRVKLILDGSGILYDPQGVDRREVRRLLFRASIEQFRPEKIHPGGYLLVRRPTRRGQREMYPRRVRGRDGISTQWLTADEMHRDFEHVIFAAEADLFIPAGGRPETIDGRNWGRFFVAGKKPTCRAIVEGANSFITAEARELLQEKGIIVIRDASANKCGVIASSYEIIANLLMSDEEFLAHKEPYVASVLKILERRAGDEARLIFRRRRESGTDMSYTRISDALSTEMNDLYTELFSFFTSRPELLALRQYRRVLLAHLPAFVGATPRFRRRIGRLPLKYRCAMAASEIASSVVYGGGWRKDFEESLSDYVEKAFPARRGGGRV